jgi:mRNA interferase HigB
MHIITHARIVVAQQRLPECSRALDFWYRLMKRGTYRNFAELKSVFGSVDKVGKVFVRYVLTHAEYDRGEWKEEHR